MAQECPDCGKPFDERCSCGYVPAPMLARPVARYCPFDGDTLEGDGFCLRGNGYPIGTPCPFACPICRQPLEWSGGCFACHGCTTGKREDWTFPGDGYYTHEVDGKRIGDGHHWVKGQGPRPTATVAQGQQFAQKIRRLLRVNAL